MCNKLVSKIVFTMFMFVFSHQVFAQSSRVAYVNVQKLIEKSAPAVAANKRLKDEFSPRSKKLIAKQKRILEIEKKIKNDGITMSKDQLGKFTKEKRNLMRSLKRDKSEYREDLSVRQNQELKKVQKKVLDAIVDLAKKEKYDMVFSQVGVLYKSDAIDITSKVIASLK